MEEYCTTDKTRLLIAAYKAGILKEPLTLEEFDKFYEECKAINRKLMGVHRYMALASLGFAVFACIFSFSALLIRLLQLG